MCTVFVIIHRKLQHPEIFLHVWLAFVLMLAISHHPKAKTFCHSELSCKKRLLRAYKRLFFCKKARLTKRFCLRIMKNQQHQNLKEKSQVTAISAEDAIVIITGFTFCGTRCTRKCRWKTFASRKTRVQYS